MGKQVEKVEGAKNPFKRGKRIGMNVLRLEEGKSVFVHLQEFGKFESLKYQGEDAIDKFEVINLETGEEQVLWVDGGLLGALSTVGGPEQAAKKKLKIEILKGKQKPLEVLNKKTNKIESAKVNTYEVWQLED